MNTKFGELTQYFIIATLSKKDTSVLSLITFHGTIGERTKKYFRVLSCVIYAMIENYVCIDYIACEQKIK